MKRRVQVGLRRHLVPAWEFVVEPEPVWDVFGLERVGGEVVWRVLFGRPLGDSLCIAVRHPGLPGVGGGGRRVEVVNRCHEFELIRVAAEVKEAVEGDGVAPAWLDDGRVAAKRPVPVHGGSLEVEPLADGECLLDRAPATDGRAGSGGGRRPNLEEELRT